MIKWLVLVGVWLVSFIIISIIAVNTLQSDDDGMFIGFFGAIGVTFLTWGLIS